MKIYINEDKMDVIRKCFINEYNTSFDNIDKDDINRIMYYVNEPDDEDYDEEMYDSYESFLIEETTYDMECYNDYDEVLLYCTWTIDEIRDNLGDDIANRMAAREGRNGGNNWYCIDDFVDTEVSDINNVEEVNNLAKRLFMVSDSYRKGDRGYLLTDGSILEFGENKDHASISSIDNMTVGKFVSLGNIRISRNSFELEKEPTSAQRNQLKRLINSYSDDEVYVDICRYDNNGTYSSSITSAKYSRPRYMMVLGEIDRYFSEGIRLMGGNMYENINFEMKPSEIDLSSFEKKGELNPEIWGDDGEMNPRVRLKLLDIADDFFSTLSVNFIKPADIIVTGSICNYNWSEYSDIDLHILIDYDDIDDNHELVQEYFDLKKNQWNDEHEGLNMFGFNVEVYVQGIDSENISGGIFSLNKNEWIKRPKLNRKDLVKNVGAILKMVSSSFITKIEDIEKKMDSTDDEYELRKLYSSLKNILRDIKGIRTNGLKDNGEDSIGNICYKILRRTGYLSKIWDVKNQLYDKINSIN